MLRIVIYVNPEREAVQNYLADFWAQSFSAKGASTPQFRLKEKIR